jgi:hypothetical protein
MPSRLRRRVEALTATTVPLTAAEPKVEPGVLALLGVPFTPLEPPELSERCTALAGRLLQAASRSPTILPPSPAPKVLRS